MATPMVPLTLAALLPDEASSVWTAAGAEADCEEADGSYRDDSAHCVLHSMDVNLRETPADRY